MRRCSASCPCGPVCCLRGDQIPISLRLLTRCFHPGTDAKVAATRICQGYGILNWHCVDALTAQIAEASTAKAAAPAPPVRKPPPPPPPELSQIVETAPEATPSAPAPKSPVQRLKELKEAFEGGLISEGAMEKKRDEILAAM